MPSYVPWYLSPAVQYIGLGLAVGLGIAGLGFGISFGDKVEVSRAQAQRAAAQAEYQRLHSIETMTQQYGHSISSRELTDLLQKNHLDKPIE